MGDRPRHGNEHEFDVVWTGPFGSLERWEADNLESVRKSIEFGEEQNINRQVQAQEWENDAQRYAHYMRFMQLVEKQCGYIEDEYADPEEPIVWDASKEESHEPAD